MKIFTCTEFMGHWPVGTAAVVCAKDAPDAANELNKVLVSHGLRGEMTAQEMVEMPADQILVRILNDGNY